MSRFSYKFVYTQGKKCTSSQTQDVWTTRSVYIGSRVGMTENKYKIHEHEDNICEAIKSIFFFWFL